MSDFDVKEKRFEQDIETFLCTDGGYLKGDPHKFDRKLALDKDTLISFIKTSQPKHWEKYTRIHGADSEKQIIDRFCREVKMVGLLRVLRQGFMDRGIKFYVVFWKPETSINEVSQKRYEANILHCTRQLHYSLNNENSIDIVLFQDVPGLADCVHRAALYDKGAADAAFFRYTMPKLAASQSHIQPLKQGRAMCEIFGAFGWSEGLPYMKALADTMLLSGINHFVPHAFTPKDEDPDCPPHFYNGGRNEQFPLFKNLMEYMGRCAHLLCGARHKADVAVFYNAEGHWTDGKNQSFRYICRELTQNLLDFDIIPNDTLLDATVENGRLLVNGETYGALILSESEVLPEQVLANLRRLAEAGLPVIFTESLPTRTAEGRSAFDFAACFEAIPTADLAKTLRDRGLHHISGSGEGLKYLRFYHAQQDGQDIYAFLNEGIHGSVAAELRLPNAGPCLIYDPWDNRCYRSDAPEGLLKLQLEKGNLLFVLFGGQIPEGTPAFSVEADRKALDLRFDVYAKDEGETEFRLLAEQAAPFDITAPEGLPEFSGELLYKAAFRAETGFSVLDLGFVGETAEVRVNGIAVGVRINAPYKFDLTPALQSGDNRLEVLVRSNPGHRRYTDGLCCFSHIPPTGILGPVALCRYEEQ